jgi:hypothetical protein
MEPQYDQGTYIESQGIGYWGVQDLGNGWWLGARVDGANQVYLIKVDDGFPAVV